MRKLFRTIAPIAAFVLVPTGAHATTTQTWTYVAATVVSCGGGVCSPQAAGQNVAPLGAFIITPVGTTITFDADDASGPKNEIDFCQENASSGTDLPNFCGDGPDDIQVFYCATGSNQTAGTFKAGNPVLVSLFAASTECDGISTTGTVKVTF